MTMLTNAFERRPHASTHGDGVATATANLHRATFRQFCLEATGVLAAGAILAAIIGLEAAFYVRTLID